MPPDIRCKHWVTKLVTASKGESSPPLTPTGHIAADALCPQQLKSRIPFIRHLSSKSAYNFNPMMEWNNKMNHSPLLLISACPPPFPISAALITDNTWRWVKNLPMGMDKKICQMNFLANSPIYSGFFFWYGNFEWFLSPPGVTLWITLSGGKHKLFNLLADVKFRRWVIPSSLASIPYHRKLW